MDGRRDRTSGAALVLRRGLVAVRATHPGTVTGRGRRRTADDTTGTAPGPGSSVTTRVGVGRVVGADGVRGRRTRVDTVVAPGARPPNAVAMVV